MNDGGPAFPCDRRAVYGDAGWWGHGMTLRDYFAAKAMQAMCSNVWPDSGDRTEIAKISYAMADAMLKARQE